MRNITNHSETRTISIAAPPAAVLDIVGDPRTLPRWAPAFARAVRPEGDHWVVDTGSGEARILVRVDPATGTVDLLSAERQDVGAFTRVLPNGRGSEYMFTLFFPDGTPEAAVADQMRTVEGELEVVRDLSEAAAG